MSQPGRDTPPSRSVLDRLIADRGARGGRLSPMQASRELHESVRRNLENLLNTRWRCVSWPPDLDELERSLVNYGIPDFTGAAFNDPISRREFRRILEISIRHYEPRFGNVRVNIVESEKKEDRTLRFRIDGVLGADGEAVAFETALDPTTATFRVGQLGR